MREGIILRQRCPICRQRASVRTSRGVTDQYTELYFRCSNFDCGHTWKSALSFVHTIAPSRLPNHGVQLPSADPRYLRARPLPANDTGGLEVPSAANDAGDDARTG